LLVFDYEI